MTAMVPADRDLVKCVRALGLSAASTAASSFVSEASRRAVIAGRPSIPALIPQLESFQPDVGFQRLGSEKA
jgi:hypothetical protein